MENPEIKTTVKHSESKDAYNIIGGLGQKFKVARIPYLIVQGSDALTIAHKNEALRHAEYISFCFNNAERILKIVTE